MSTRISSIKTKKSIFWDSFFFFWGLNANPILDKVKEVAAKSADQRISESWERTSETFKEAYEKQACIVNE
jgi:hypothetical protein